MPNLLYDTPTPPSQLYSTSAAVPGRFSGLPATSIKPRFKQPLPASEAVVTSTVLPKSRLREQYRPEVDFGLDSSSASSSDSTFSSADLVTHNNNRHHDAAMPAYGDENRDPQQQYNSPGYGDASTGLGMHDKQRFVDVQRSAARPSPRRNPMAARVDEYSDGTADSSSSSRLTSSSESEDEFAARNRALPSRQQQQQQGPPNTAGRPRFDLTSTPYPGPGVSSNNISKSAFDGMARELRKEFERIMHAGQTPAPRQHAAPPVTEQPSPPPQSTRPRRTSTIRHIEDSPHRTSPSYVQYAPSPLPRAVEPSRTRSPAAAAASANRASNAVSDTERTPTTQRTFGREIRFPTQAAPSRSPADRNIHSASLRKPAEQPKPIWQQSEYDSPFRAPVYTAANGTIPPNNSRATTQPSVHLADSPERLSAIPSSYHALRVPDITGITEGLTSPSRVASGPSSHRDFASIGSGSPVLSGRLARRSREDLELSSALSDLRRRLEALESENARSEAKVAELQDRLASGQGSNHLTGNGLEDGAQQDFVQKLQSEIAHLHHQISGHNKTLKDLQSTHTLDAAGAASDVVGSWQGVFTQLQNALKDLADQVSHIRGILEEVLASMRHTRDSNLLRVHQEFEHRAPLANARTFANDKTYGGGYAAATHPAVSTAPHGLSSQPAARPSSAPTSAPLALPSRTIPADYRVSRPGSNPLPERTQPAPYSLQEPLLDRAERILSTLPPRLENHGPGTCHMCHGAPPPRVPNVGDLWSRSRTQENQAESQHQAQHELPMETVVTRALRDLEDDFAVHKRIYIELSEEYKRMDPALPDVGKRKVLASHLKESIDVLEMKADEIKRLYDLLHYQDGLLRQSEAFRLRAGQKL